jgi:hypothetical protein
MNRKTELLLNITILTSSANRRSGIRYSIVWANRSTMRLKAGHRAGTIP